LARSINHHLPPLRQQADVALAAAGYKACAGV
jgi:hypothetical protein